MKFKKKDIEEIVNKDGDLIGADEVPPAGGSDEESAANGTTDYNSQISHQPFRFDMLSRFGFLSPFFEDGSEDKKSNPLLNDIAKYLYEHYLSMMGEYYKNPKKLQHDYRKKIKGNFKSDGEHEKDMAEELINIIIPYFKESVETYNNEIEENKFIEGKVLKDKTDKGLSKEKKGKTDILSQKDIEKIAGLINKKFNKKNVDKLKNLLEGNNE